jgi:diguanylate cyclase (GGDEF)-like protein
MNDEQINVLIIEDNPPDSVIVREYLKRDTERHFEVVTAIDLDEGLERLSREEIDIVLLDLSLPDCEGYETFNRVHSHSPKVPVVVMTGLDDEEMAVSVLSEGAQDFLVKGRFDSDLLKRSVTFSIEREKVERDLLDANKEIAGLAAHLQEVLESVTEMAHKDPLTGIANSRYFYEVATLELEMERRYNHPSLALAYLDIDDFKAVNDRHGHMVGDQLLRKVARIMSDEIRSVDVPARVGGDEFVILLPESDAEACMTAMRRLQSHLLRVMEENEWPVTVSIGVACYSSVPASVEEMVASADRLMYEVKNEGKNGIRIETVDRAPDRGDIGEPE